MRPVSCHSPQHPHFSQRFLVSHVAHAARVQQHYVSFSFVGYPLVAACDERMRDLFRVALVHLAAIGLDEKFRHGRAKTIHASAAFAMQRLCPFQQGDFLRLNRSAHEGTDPSNRRHWWQRALSNGGIARRNRTQDRHPIWAALRYAHWRNAERAPGVLPAAPWPRSSDSAARNQSPGQYLRVALAQRLLDYFCGGGGQLAGKICAAGYGLAVAVLRSYQQPRGSYVFW